MSCNNSLMEEIIKTLPFAVFFCPGSSGQISSNKGAITIVTLFILAFYVFFFLSTISINGSSNALYESNESKKTQYPQLNCSHNYSNQTCPKLITHVPEIEINFQDSTKTSCPGYFNWIHEDLKPWKKTGITREMVEKGKEKAHVRIILVNGKLHVHKYRQAFQTRDVFSLWGILQLLRLYPGMLPDFDIMFQFGDVTTVGKSDYEDGAAAPPPVFHYCGDDSTYDIVFPDWSFWGWSELNIEPWSTLRKELEQGNRHLKWIDREPYAYWKGNSYVSPVRKDLINCDITKGREWNARIHNLNWNEANKHGNEANKHGFSDTKLVDECNYRYKVYAEGRAWSVSEKYILGCDSMTLYIKPRYYDFFSRDLLPLVHYWPINHINMCRSIKYAVDWGNNHKKEAQVIGRTASEYIQEKVKMENVYDYMFHLLSEYGKLLKYKPTIPKGAVEMCSERIVCGETGLNKMYKMDSMVERPSNHSPCAMPLNLGPDLDRHVKRKEKLIKQVEMWEESGKI